MNPKDDKERMKRLREARQTWISRAKDSIKTQAALIKAIRGELAGGAKTVPQIAAATGFTTAQVLLYVSGLRKYGVVAEGPKDGDYYSYILAAKTYASGVEEVP